ncbi:Membrane carboxypeptidase [Pseudomonas syringae pv. actinidiae]|uniref:Membrane carboxypeptidase n=1 Tax=Pseudomonas syringae pv. actinidiae TaxID=103796 RepID=A0AAN4TJE9_PSESF|nr:Membrane carboxypeptidase [Pseudomonas syringae pv. actinidiae]
MVLQSGISVSLFDRGQIYRHIREAQVFVQRLDGRLGRGGIAYLGGRIGSRCSVGPPC